MIVDLCEVLSFAEEKNCAIGAFNTPNLESVMAVIQTAEKFNVPVIISHAEIHEEVMPLDIIGPIMVNMARISKVPVCVHLDHGENIAYLHRALVMGFTSIMYDGSSLPYIDNVTNTKTVVSLAQKYSAGVEAELGIIGGRESGDGAGNYNYQYTDPESAKLFIEDTRINALACSFGTAHGFYTKKPVLDFELVKRIYTLTNTPLVMHGGSGVSSSEYREAIKCGVRKINYYSYMSNAAVKGVKQFFKTDDVMYFHDVATVAVKSMADDIEKSMKVFYCLE